ncbi:MAG: amidohydrolase family protein [Firmicutes bacterium]|nr:amidohydrolase family protein [Bacillota bacterium]
MRGWSFDFLYLRAGQEPIPGGAVVVEAGDVVWAGPASGAPVRCTHMGGVALPGFVDAHVHLTATGLELTALNAGEFDNIPDLLAAIGRQVPDVSGVVRVWGFDHDQYREGRYPTLAELDAACPDHLLWINHIESHGTLVNSKSLNTLGVVSNHALLVGVENGIARQFFMGRITQEQRRAGIWAAVELALARGVTSIHAMEGGRLFHNLDILAVQQLLPELPIDIVLYPQVTEVDYALSLGLKQIGGCLPLDGSSGVYTAALTSTYHQSDEQGHLYFSREELLGFARAAQKAGLQMAMHACGDAAIDLALDVIEIAAREYPAPLRHRIEHFEIPRRDQARRCRDLNVILSMQPAFDWFWGGPDGDYARTLGPERWQDVNPLGWAVAEGLPVAGGSDSGVTPLNPLLGIQAAVSHHNPVQRVDVARALAMFTEDAALAGGAKAGRLVPGQRANITVLSADPHTEPVNSIRYIPVLATFVGGELRYCH